MIFYQGNLYRDDRIFVINISRGTVQKSSKGSKKETRWLLSTYRNVASLPCRSSHNFETRKEVIEYLRQVEPNTPLISNHGKRLDIPAEAEPWEYWMEWLKDRNLKSAITGYQNVPDWLAKQGGVPKNDYVEVIELTEEKLE